MKHSQSSSGNTFSKKTWLIVFIIGLFGLVSLLKDHTSHIVSILPYLILLACPLMHLFMHGGGHGRHEHDDKQDYPNTQPYNH